ncbi:MAG: helicase HerA-like domain-containing protein [Candidatus Nanosalina sp.]
MDSGNDLNISAGRNLGISGIADASDILNLSAVDKATISGTARAQRAEIDATNIEITGTGLVSSNGRGYSAGSGPGAGGANSGAGHGGLGQNNPGSMYGTELRPTNLGSGATGPGGGAIQILADQQIINDGEVTADGQNGGSGGSIWTSSTSLTGSGVFTADGGSGSYDGAGGRIHLDTESPKTDWNGNVYTRSGGNAGPGTTRPKNFICDQGTLSTECEINSQHAVKTLSGSGNLTMSNGEIRSYEHDLTLGFNKFEGGTDSGIYTDQKITFETDIFTWKGDMDAGADINVNNGGGPIAINGSVDTPSSFSAQGSTIDVASNAQVRSQRFFATTNDFELFSGSSISTDARGYRQGPGSGGVNSGGGYGGQGGGPNGGTDYGVYGSPSYMGSGGDDGNYRGGGQIRIEASDLVRIDGTLSSDGEDGGDAGGAGGSILINSNTFSGDGTITASGGAGIEAGGGGGRIAVYRQNDAFDGTIEAPGGTSNTAPGEDGTVFITETAEILAPITVTVKDRNGNPVTNKPVTVEFVDSGLSACSFRTDAQGQISCKVLETEQYNIVSRVFSSTIEGPLKRGISVPTNVTIRENTEITVEEIETGSPVNNAQVTILSTSGEQICRGPTDSSGKFSCALQDTNYNVKVEKPGYRDKTVFMYRPDDKVIELSETPAPFKDSICGQTGEITVTNSCTVSAGSYKVKSFKVESGATVTFRGDPAMDGPANFGGVEINSMGPITINGEINADGQGYSTYTGPGSGTPDEYGNGGAGYGGTGGSGGGNSSDGGAGGSTYGSASEAKRLGSGGSDAGGGAVWLDSRRLIRITGTVSADGQKGDYGDGGGSGGSIRLEAPQIKGSGILTANGGDGGNHEPGDNSSIAGGGGGSGGRISVFSATGEVNLQHEITGGTGGDGGDIFWVNRTDTQSFSKTVNGSVDDRIRITVDIYNQGNLLKTVDRVINVSNTQNLNLNPHVNLSRSKSVSTDITRTYVEKTGGGSEVNVDVNVDVTKWEITDKNTLSGTDGEDGGSGSYQESRLTENFNITLKDGKTLLSDRRVELVRNGTPYIEAEGYTDSNGKFMYEVPQKNTLYDIKTTAWSGRMNTIRENIDLPFNEVLEDNMVITVLDSARTPVSGVKVFATEEGSNRPACTGITNSSGMVTCSLNESKTYDISTNYPSWKQEFSVNPPAKVTIANYHTLTLLMNEIRTPIDYHPANMKLTVSQGESQTPLCTGVTNSIGRVACSLSTEGSYDISVKKYNVSEDEKAYYPFSVIRNNIGIPRTEEIEVENNLLDITAVGSTGVPTPLEQINVTEQNSGGLACEGETDANGKIYCMLDNSERYTIRSGSGLLRRFKVPVASSTTVQQTSSQELLNITFKDEFGDRLEGMPFRVQKQSVGEDACSGITNIFGTVTCGVDTATFNLMLGDDSKPVKTDVSPSNSYTIQRHWDHYISKTRVVKGDSVTLSGQIWYGSSPSSGRKLSTETIDIYLDGEKIGSTVTDADGKYSYTFTPENAGTHTARLEVKDKYGQKYQRKVTFGVIDTTQDIDIINVTIEDGGQPIYEKITVSNLANTTYLTGYPDDRGHAGFAVFDKEDYVASSRVRTVSPIQPPSTVYLTPYASVKVVDISGNPVENEDVYVNPEGTSGPSSAVCITQTDQNGEAFCPLDYNKDYDVRIGSAIGTPRIKGRSPIELVTPTAGKGDLRYTVKDASGNRLKKEEFRVLNQNGKTVCRARSTSQGNFYCQPTSTNAPYNIETAAFTGVKQFIVKGQSSVKEPKDLEPTLTVKLLDLNGNGLGGISVEVINETTGQVACEGESNATGYLICTVPKNANYTIESAGGVERTGVQPVQKTQVQVGAPSNNEMLNLSLKGPEGNFLKDTRITIRQSGTGALACRGYTNSQGLFNCGLSSNNQYNIYSEGSQLLRNVEVPADLELGRNLEVTVVNSTGHRIQGAKFNVRETFGNEIACTGTSGENGVFRCGLVINQSYDIYSEQYGLERERVKMPEITTIQLSSQQKYMNITLRNKTGARLNGENIVIRDMNKTPMCGGETNAIGEIVCGLDPSKEYEIVTDAYNSRPQAIRSSLIPPSNLNIRTNANVSLLNYTGTPPDAEIYIRENSTGEIACRGELAGDNLVCSLEFGKNYSIEPYPNRTINASAAVLSPPFKQPLQTIAVKTYNPENSDVNDPANARINRNASITYRGRQICRAATGAPGQEPLICGVTPERLYSIKNPVKNVTGIKPNESLRIGYGSTTASEVKTTVYTSYNNYGVIGANFSYPVTVENTGSNYMYDIRVNVTAPGGRWKGYSTFRGGLAPGEKRNITVDVYVPDDASDEVQEVSANVSWTEPRIRNESEIGSGSIFVIATGRVSSDSELEATLQEGETFQRVGEFRINSVGNRPASADYQIAGINWTAGFDPLPELSIPIGESRNVTTFLSVPENTLQGEYSAKVELYDTSYQRRKDDEVNITVHVPPSIQYSRSPQAFEAEDVAIGTNGTIGNLTVSNDGNQNLTFSINKQVEIAGSSNFIRVDPDDRGFDLRPGDVKEIPVSYEVGADETGGIYNFNLTVGCSPGCDTRKTDITLDVKDIPPEITDFGVSPIYAEPNETVNFRVNATDNKKVEEVTVSFLEGRNITANRSKFNRKRFFASFKPTVEEASFSFKVYARDGARPDPLVTESQIGEFFVVPDTVVNSELNRSNYLLEDIRYRSGASISNLLKINNSGEDGAKPQEAKNVRYNVILPNANWSASPSQETLGTLAANEARFRNLTIDIPADTSPGTYRPLVRTKWENADGTNGTNERRFRIDVAENPRLETEEQIKRITAAHDTSESFNTTLRSTGNVFAEDISSVCAEGSACDEMFVTIEGPDILQPGEESPVNITVAVPRGTPPDTYSGTIVFRSTDAQTNLTFEVDVPKNVNYTVSPDNLSARIGTGGNIALEEIELLNNGNQPLEISMPTNPNFRFRPTSLSLDPGDLKTANVVFQAPDKPGQKTYNLTVGGFDADTFEKTERYINVSTEIVDFEVSLDNITKPKGLEGGEAFKIKADAQFNNQTVTESVEWVVRVGGKKANVFSSEYSSSEDSWILDLNAPNLEQGRIYNLEILGRYTKENVENNVLVQDKIYYEDKTGPEFVSTVAEDVRNADALLTAQVQDPGEVEDVKSVNATVYHPDGSKVTINLKQGRGEWSGEVSDGFLDELGYYDVVFRTNDTAGNTRTYETFIQNFRNQRIQGDIKDPAGEGVTTTIELMRPGTDTVIEKIKAVNGEYDEIIREGRYDVVYDIGSTAFIQLNNLSSDKLQGNPLDIDPNIQEQYVDIPNASAENELIGIAVNETGLGNFTGLAAINYSRYESALLNIRYLKIHKCEQWLFNNKAAGCLGDWEVKRTQILPEQELAATDISGFSSFYMAQRIGFDQYLNGTQPSEGDENVTGGGGGGGGSGSGGSGGGGGGGSGLTQEQFNEQIDRLVDNLNGTSGRQGPSARFNNDRIDAQLKPGQTYTTTIGIQNNLNRTQTFTTTVEGPVSRFLAVTDNLDIAPDQTGQISVFISIPENATQDTYSDTLVVESEETSKNIPVNLQVIPEDKKLLDLVIDPVFDQVNPGETLQLETSLSNQGYSQTVDVNLSVMVVDSVTDEAISRSTKTVAVSTTLDRVFEVALPEDIELGEYEIRANASYINKDSPYVASSIATIEVRQSIWKRTTFGVKNMYLAAAGVVLILLIAAGYFGYTYYRKKQLEKQRYDEDLDISTLPSGGPRQAFVGKLAEKDTRAYYELEQLKTHALIAGATGSGKTVTGQDIVEEALEEGTTVIVLDPTAQWSGFLRECDDSDMLSHYEEFNMSKDERTGFNGNIRAISPGEEIDITPYLESDDDDDEGEIIVFTMHKMDSDHIDDFVDSTIQQVFDANLPERNELETLIVYDEVHRLLEKFGGSGQGLKQLERGAREFRKWGVGMILLSQVVADFSGEIRANIGTTIQMRTQYEGDLDRIKNKYDMKTVKSIVKADIGSGMVQNSDYNHGRPYFVNFRPMLHSPHRLSDEKLEKYEKYNKQINDLEARIDQKEENGEDVFELRSELQLARKNLRKGSFNLVEVYIDELENRM